MPLLDNTRRIKTDDFQPEYRQLVAQLGEVLNFFMEQVTNTVNGKLDFSNLASSVRTITITVDASGVPIASAQLSTDFNVKGVVVLSAKNLTSSTTYPTGAPFISFQSITTNKFEIKKITGLPANNKFELLLWLVP